MPANVIVDAAGGPKGGFAHGLDLSRQLLARKTDQKALALDFRRGGRKRTGVRVHGA